MKNITIVAAILIAYYLYSYRGNNSWFSIGFCLTMLIIVLALVSNKPNAIKTITRKLKSKNENIQLSIFLYIISILFAIIAALEKYELGRRGYIKIGKGNGIPISGDTAISQINWYWAGSAGFFIIATVFGLKFIYLKNRNISQTSIDDKHDRTSE